MHTYYQCNSFIWQRCFYVIIFAETLFCMNIVNRRAYFRISTPIMTIISCLPLFSKWNGIFWAIICYYTIHFLFMKYDRISKAVTCNRLKWIAFINIPTYILSILPCKFPQIILFLANIILLIYTWRKFRKKTSQKHTANA